MAEICSNCGNEIVDSFCSKCGQKKYKRISKQYVWEELQYTVFHTNKGFLYSIKKILKNPGKTAREFIEGNRVNHYKPILLVFVLSGISTFVSFKVLNFKEIMTASFTEQQVNSNYVSDMLSFMSSYNSLLMLLYIPLFALTTKIAFRKWNHNYYEHIVMNAYILAYYTLFSLIVVYPIMFFFRHSLTIYLNISTAAILIVPFILVWFFRGFYPDKPLKSIILRVLGSLGFVIVSYILFVFLVGIILLILTLTHGPEVIEYIQPN